MNEKWKKFMLETEIEKQQVLQLMGEWLDKLLVERQVTA
jgi:hypothetical protein